MQMVHFIPPSQRRLAMLAAQADSAPALIYGASGTGTSTIARWIHANGARATKALKQATHDLPLIRQLPEAHGGTLLIAEIGEYPLAEQKALLQYLTTKSVPHPEDPEMKILVNARIIATTSQTLEGRAQSGLFNAELLEKLNVFRLEMPPLCKRQDEFEDIATGIVGEISRELHKEHLRGLDEPSWKRLKAYEWPGNLRELRNVLRVAVVAAQGDRITLSDLPEFGPDRIDFRATREEFERIYLTELLKAYDWEIDRTCANARMDKATLQAKIERYDLKPETLPQLPPNLQ